MEKVTPALFTARMEEAPTLQGRRLDPARGREYRNLISAFAEILDSSRAPFDALPALIKPIFEHRGWAWNGIYALRGDRLELYAAAGPPVCHTIERKGGVGSSGMCFDAILLNQTLVTSDVKQWTGYVSCDDESGLQTQAGLVCPIRDAQSDALAVWDLDCTQALAPEDAPFFDWLFQVLSTLLRPSAHDFR